MKEIQRVSIDCYKTVKSWRTWLYLGMQDVRNQYKRSRLGISWILINILIMAIGIGYIYGHLFHQNMAQFIPMLIISISLWIFFTTNIIQACNTFINSEGYIKQFPFPKQVYIFRLFVSSLVPFLLGLIIFFILAFSYGVSFSAASLWFIPGLILLMIINLGHLVIFAYWGCRFRDLSPAFSGLFQILFYVTPIIFTPDMLKARGLDFIYLYNPFYYLLEVVRYPLLNAAAPAFFIYDITCIYTIIISTLALLTMVSLDKKVPYYL